MLKLRNLPLIKVNKSSSRDKQFDRPEKKLPNQPPFNITVLLLYIAGISSLHPRQ